MYSERDQAAAPERDAVIPHLTDRLGGRPIVLVGMMGCGKSSIGRRLATCLGVEFVDADQEIEKAAGQSIKDIFATYGEAEFRAGERRVIQRLIGEHRGIIATGGGAFVDRETRSEIARDAVSVWLRVAPEILYHRVSRRNTRPLLQTADPEGTLRALLAEREPIYALADLTIDSDDGPHDAVVDAILAAVSDYLVAGRPVSDGSGTQSPC
ncbi:MAG: shikimate kinase [Pseudomonadota bacterium]